MTGKAETGEIVAIAKSVYRFYRCRQETRIGDDGSTEAGNEERHCVLHREQSSVPAVRDFPDGSHCTRRHFYNGFG